MRVVVLVLMALATACGGGNSAPSSPTPTVPSVAGNYSGSATFTLPELEVTMTCPASTTVTQSGRTINVAPLILAGECGGTSIPLGQATIDVTGAIEGGSARGTYNEPSCGTYSFTASGGFFGRELRLSVTATSSTCFNFNLTVVLSR